MADEQRDGPSKATGSAALRAGWSHSHRDVSGGWLRPTVFGVVDGLRRRRVRAHRGADRRGVAGGGRVLDGHRGYISVTNQNELVAAEVSLEQRMLARFPAAEQEELAGYFRQYGADPDTAAGMAAAVSADPETALRVHTRQELGVDPEELPSPLLAGVASLLGFSLGALVPLLPWLSGAPYLRVTLALTAVGLAALGTVVGRLTGRPVLRSGLRQLALGTLALAVTYGVGHPIGSRS